VHHSKKLIGAGRFGSKADVGSAPVDVRVTLESGHQFSALGCPLCAISRHHTYEGLSNSKTASRPGRSCDSTICKRSDFHARTL
jgi:hypothetical protein